jgi:hypothetical protein
LTSRDRGGDQRILDAVQIVELELMNADHRPPRHCPPWRSMAFARPGSVCPSARQSRAGPLEITRQRPFLAAKERHMGSGD